MCTFRTFLHTFIYLGAGGLFLAGILQFPVRPPIVSSGVSMEDASKAIDAQYSDIVKNSDALKYLVSGIVGILCNLVAQLVFRRGVQRIRPQPRLAPAPVPVAAPAAPVPVPVAAPAPQVVIHELHQPTWVEKAYMNSKRTLTPYPDPPL